MKINKTKPPKNREFLGLVADRDGESPAYWDFFWWATKDTGSNGPSCYQLLHKTPLFRAGMQA